MDTFVMLLYVWLAMCGAASACPQECDCSYMNGTTYLYVDCSGLALNYIPHDIPEDSYYVDLSQNEFRNFSDELLRHVKGLVKLDLRENPHLDEIPFFYSNSRMRIVYVDSGFTCCIFEMEYDSSFAINSTELLECVATEPYTECSENLIRVFTIVLYAFVVFFSFIFNPWIMIVTMGLRQLRKDPITFNVFHFCTANLLTTIYAAVMLGKGIRFHGEYHYHMEDWLENPGCSLIGCMLIVATLVSAILYMIEVICLFMKLRYPLKIDRHMTMRKLNITVGVTWLVAIFIGVMPFMTKRTYNAVGLCVPFYNDGVLPFKYVIFYTVIMGSTVVVNATLAILLLRSFMRNRKLRHAEIPAKLMQDLLAVEKVILIALSVYILIAVINVAFLIMSCVGGTVGKIGREWYTRMVVLETVTYPLVGPLRRPQFYKNSKRLLEKWGCFKWDKDQEHSTSQSVRARFLPGNANRQSQVKLGSSFNTNSSAHAQS